ncbi:MAG: type I DNA topoisomerase [Bacilli bacterium]|jgi:DNA topoisomerase-1
MKLVIVESPKKSESFSRYLGVGYTILATQGHLRDLATSGKGGLGVDIENNFKPNYKLMPKKAVIWEKIKSEAKKSEEILLATDPDREGEAIAWHLADLLKLNIDKTKRLEFHEITRDSIQEAIKKPRIIDMNLVNSQETRRILDRIIGFKLSALMQKKLRSPSAGRVQTATLKIICDHEKDIKKFIPEEYWDIVATVEICGKLYDLALQKVDGRNANIANENMASELYAKLGDALRLDKIIKKVRSVPSKPPFKTSTLQQEASNRFHFSTSKTASIAQSLYEGITVGDEHVGLVTYIRTDSTRLSETFIQRARNYITETFGAEYIGQVKKEKASPLGQDAHEAIRPTSNHRTPNSVSKYLSYDQMRLYRLIYDRAVASLMSDAKEEITTAILKSGNLEFKLDTKKVLFDGHRRLYDDGEPEMVCTPPMQEGTIFSIIKKAKIQKYTTPPARYSEAKVVQLMEEAGIGRPSTYASTIRLLLTRKYIEAAKEGLVATEQGMKTATVVAKYFPEFADVSYTAKMESDLDQIQFGKTKHLEMLTNFYAPFELKVKEAYSLMYKEPEESTGDNCPLCGSPLVYKQSKHGQFVACSSYPTCKYIKKPEKKEPEYTGENCPECGRPLVIRKYGRNKSFVACSGYPSCKYAKNDSREKEHQHGESENEDLGQCPKCGGQLKVRTYKKSKFIGCSNYPKCDYHAKYDKK